MRMWSPFHVLIQESSCFAHTHAGRECQEVHRVYAMIGEWAGPYQKPSDLVVGQHAAFLVLFTQGFDGLGRIETDHTLTHRTVE